jgi:proton-coupled amino acid transporter
MYQKDDNKSDSASSANASSTSNITYPDVGDWAYGASFQTYVAAALCTQQLAICTVFLSFFGENLLAILQCLDLHLVSVVAIGLE